MSEKRSIMNRITHLNKFKAAAALLVIMVLLVLNNFTGRKSFVNVGESFSSIYNDRLMPATYIFNISDHLYRSRLLLDGDKPDLSLERQLAAHDGQIVGLIRDYETTYLTAEEEKQWQAFKSHLEVYHATRFDPAFEHTAMTHFNDMMQCLHNLSRIQVGEGSALHTSSKAIIAGSNTFSEFEMSLVVVLGLFSVVMISLPQKPFAGGYGQQFSMN